MTRAGFRNPHGTPGPAARGMRGTGGPSPAAPVAGRAPTTPEFRNAGSREGCDAPDAGGNLIQ
jgi:hypothetical protein